MEQNAIHLALDDAGVDQADEGLEQHFTDAVEALFKRRGFERLTGGRKPLHGRLELRGIAMAEDQSLRERVASLADTDLQRAAVANETGRMKADGVFGVGDRLRRRRKQRKLRFRALQHRAEFVA